MVIDSFIYHIKCPDELIMNLSDIQGNSLIISIALTLLVGAIIVYYLNTRMVTLEKSLARQNTILSEFITNIRNEIAGPSLSVSPLPSGPASNDATPEAKLSAEAFASNPNEKINVSDDSESESDSDYDSETDEDSMSESDNDKQHDTTEDTLEVDDIKVIDLKSESEPKEEIVAKSNDVEETTKTISLLNVEEVGDVDVESLKVQSDSDIESDTDNEADDETIAEAKNDVALQDVETLPENITASSTISPGLDVHQLFAKHLEVEPTANENESVTTTNYQKFKVDELRRLAKEGNLGSEDDINKMKKKELITLLSNSEQ